MWQPAVRARTPDEVPIGHVTNGVHVPTWMAAPMRELLDRHLGEGLGDTHRDDPTTWEALDAIPDAELWAVRCRLRAALVEYVRERATVDRLARGEPRAYVQLAAHAFDPNRLTVGFARRLATYKRLHLLTRDLGRALQLLDGDRPVQIVLAGKAHPRTTRPSASCSCCSGPRAAPHVGERIAYLHDYDMEMAQFLVAGCDVWLNLPRPPLEASGTSGMKAALNGGLNLSVLDGWWAEGFDGNNGWAIERRRGRRQRGAGRAARRDAARADGARGGAALLRTRRQRHSAGVDEDGESRHQERGVPLRGAPDARRLRRARVPAERRVTRPVGTA